MPINPPLFTIFQPFSLARRKHFFFVFIWFIENIKIDILTSTYKRLTKKEIIKCNDFMNKKFSHNIQTLRIFVRHSLTIFVQYSNLIQFFLLWQKIANVANKKKGIKKILLRCYGCTNKENMHKTIQYLLRFVIQVKRTTGKKRLIDFFGAQFIKWIKKFQTYSIERLQTGKN